VANGLHWAGVARHHGGQAIGLGAAALRPPAAHQQQHINIWDLQHKITNT